MINNEVHILCLYCYVNDDYKIEIQILIHTYSSVFIAYNN